MARIRKADGEKLKAFREDLWMTQVELSAKSGVNRMTISEIERGRNHSPRRGTIKALAAALNVDPNELLEGRDGTGPLAGTPARGRLARQADQPRLSLAGPQWPKGTGE